MSFLSPWSALAAAAVAVPLLLLLYVLKLRRRMLKIPSTILWRQTTRDLEVNAPFSRLRWSLLLLLQMLALLTVLAALAEPLLDVQAAASSRVIIIIDRSASMNALDGPGTPGSSGARRSRLDEAKEAAARIAQRVGRGGGPDSVMVLAFGASAQIVSPFDSRRDVLLEAIAAIEPTDEIADLAAAFKLAGAFATRDEQSPDALPEVVLISDGGVGPSPAEGGFTLRCSRIRYVEVGPGPGPGGPGAGVAQAVRNVGIASLGVRRDYDDPARVRLFARLVNAGPEPVSTSARLMVDGEPAAVQTVQVPAATPGGPPGEAPLSLSLELPGTAALTVAQNFADDMACDDVAAIVLPAPLSLRIALVHPSDGSGADPFLRDLIAALEPAELKEMSPAALDSLDPQALDSGALYDLIVFDRVSPAQLPGVPSLTVGGAPDGVGVVEPREPGGRRIVSWDRTHPIMRHVALDDLVFADFGSLKLPAVATPLAFGPDGPVIALLPAHGARHVVVGFPLIKSNWPTNVSISIFLQNVVDYLTLLEASMSAGGGAGGAGGGIGGGLDTAGAGGGGGLVFRPGEPVPVRLRSRPGQGGPSPSPGSGPGAGAGAGAGSGVGPGVGVGTRTITITGPDGTGRTAVAGNLGAGMGYPGGAGLSTGVMLPPFRRVGLYRIDGVAPPMDRVAVSLLSDSESDIRPRPGEDLVVNSKAVAGTGVAGAAPIDLWPWLVAAALGLLIIEWLVYCVRVRK